MKYPARILALIVATLVLTSCAPATTLEATTGAALQQEVVAAATLAAAGDPAGALARLDALEQTLLEATAAGSVSSDRSAQISASVSLVRKDLEALIVPIAPSPTPTEADDDEDDDNEGPGNNGNGNGNGNGNKDKDKDKD